MTDDEKTDVINKMKAGQLKLLVASTVIEVGVTFPGLTLLVAVSPEHFGVAQLHQLRGQVARKGAWVFHHVSAEPHQTVSVIALATFDSLQ